MLIFNPQNGKLENIESGMSFSDLPYRYSINGLIDDEKIFWDDCLSDKKILDRVKDEIVIRGIFKNANIEVIQILKTKDNGIKETITIKNLNFSSVQIQDIKMGMVADISTRKDWRLCSIPFKVQLDGSVHDYSAQDLKSKNFKNAVFTDPCRMEPPLKEEGKIRSEAFAWGVKDKGLAIIKYNNEDIELSVAFPQNDKKTASLCFGGVGICLYGEPMAACSLLPGESFTFGETRYIPYEGEIENAFYTYRNFIEDKGHGFPMDYNPPLNWNELYDIGWYHSNTKLLMENYTKEALLEQAKLAQECNCELFYLDPGWEVAEGTSLWDETRLGSVPELIETLKEDFGLDLGYRTILRSYTNHFDTKYIVSHGVNSQKKGEDSGPIGLIWPYCLCNPEFFEEKKKRLVNISKHGVKFMMFDEMDWRGYCYDTDHGHEIPTKPLDHVRAVYEFAKEVKKSCPGLIAEVHDPLWAWHTAIYVPTYFGQGFGNKGFYEENWGFEYMWNCLDDLQTGKALSLYYYNLASSIPLYLHITMAADNDNSLFFWWCASTIRHLGIGGKYSHKSVEDFEGGLPEYDEEKRFSNYKENTKLYQKLKAYFVRGRFWGLSETIHFHTLPGISGGVLTMFNLTKEEKEIQCLIPNHMLGTISKLSIENSHAKIIQEGVRIRTRLKPMSPFVLFIGDKE